MKISIITPVKNRIFFIQSCIDSVSSQTYSNYEHLIIDGFSTDGTLEIIKKNQFNKQNNIKYISEIDDSVGQAWNKGLAMSSGDVIGWLGAEDSFSSHDVLATIAKYFNDNSDVFVAYGGCNFLNEKGEIYGKSDEYNYSFKRLLNKTNFIPATSLFFRKPVYESVGFYDSYGNDFDYILRIAKQYNIHSISRILSNFVLAKDSETGDLRKYVKVLKLDWAVSRKHGGYYFNNYHRRYLIFSFLFLLGLGDILNKLKNKKRGNL